MKEPVTRFGVYLYALATIAAGVLDLIWGEFEAAHQPIGALGDHIPGQTIFAYITAVWMIAAGVAILWRRTTRWGALAAAAIYLVFALFWLPRFITVPRIIGFSLTLFFGLLAGMFTQLIVVAGGLLIYSPKVRPLARWIFGLGALLFGFAHLSGVQDVSRMMPAWTPLGGSFWVVLTGVAFLLAGLSILSGILDRIAAHLLALMLLLFEISLISLVIGSPHNHIPWGSNAYSLAAAGAVMIFAGLLSGSSRQVTPVVMKSVP
ncbi:MAG TPA: DoxX family membrane protein [Pyrinomonadaceae bacterium]